MVIIVRYAMNHFVTQQSTIIIRQYFKAPLIIVLERFHGIHMQTFACACRNEHTHTNFTINWDTSWHCQLILCVHNINSYTYVYVFICVLYTPQC